MKNLTLAEVEQAVCGRLSVSQSEPSHSSGDRIPLIADISTDSRKIKKDALFIPIKGENFDGHDYIKTAFENGALCCLSEKQLDSPQGNIIHVDSTRQALKDLAEYYAGKFDIVKVAVTGSVGKTSTKDIIASVLAKKYNILKTSGNFNNEIGLPLTVFQLEDTHQAAVFEMGMSDFGEIHSLSKIVKPHIAVITNIGVSHIESLGSKEGILKAKCEIFDFLTQDGAVVLNCDDDMLSNLELNFNTKWFGINNKNNVYAENIQSLGLSGTRCDIITPAGSINVTIPYPGTHMVYNALCAAVVGLSVNVGIDDIKTGIEEFKLSDMRMDIIKLEKGYTVINDAYNANPVSMKAAIDVLSNTSGKKTAILGDMFELGENTNSLHYEIGQYACGKGIDTIICIGSLAQEICRGSLESAHKDVFYFTTIEEFLEEGLEIIKRQDSTVLVKASHAMHFEKIIEKIQEVK